MSDARTPEGAGVHTRTVALAAGGLFAIVALAAGAVWLLYPSVRAEPVPAVETFPAPGLEIQPVAAYAAYLAAQRARLAGADGRLPIERAMARVAARGPDAFGPAIAPATPGARPRDEALP